MDAGCTVIVPLGLLGEVVTLSVEDKLVILCMLVTVLNGCVLVVSGIVSLAIGEAVALVKVVKDIGCGGLMVLSLYVYFTDWCEMGVYVCVVIAVTDLLVILYNNLVVYKIDFGLV